MDGQRRSKTTETKTEAKRWAAMVEAELQRTRSSFDHQRTVADAVARYVAEVLPQKQQQASPQSILRRLKKYPLNTMPLLQVTPVQLAGWRDALLAEGLRPSTVNRALAVVSHMLTVARKEWGWLEKNPMEGVRNVSGVRARTRRPTQEESNRLVAYLKAGNVLQQQTAVLWLLALETAMRRGELLGLTPEYIDLERRIVHLPRTKNGDPRTVPLSTRAVELLRNWECVVTERQVGRYFAQACRKLGIQDLHFHDSRREALTRLSTRFSVMELARISGHRDTRILYQVYYAPDVSDLVAKLP